MMYESNCYRSRSDAHFLTYDYIKHLHTTFFNTEDNGYTKNNINWREKLVTNYMQRTSDVAIAAILRVCVFRFHHCESCLAFPLF